MLYLRVCQRCHVSQLAKKYRYIGNNKYKKICILCETHLKTNLAIIKNHPEVIVTKRGVQTTMTMYYARI